VPQEIAIAVEWAAVEGWNPGRQDAECFAAVDPTGFLIGEVGGEPVATISNVNYDELFSFLGFYIVRPDRRGRGYGLRMWQAGLAHSGARTTGLDGVVAQQSNYRKSGFVLAYRNIRFGGVVAAPTSLPSGVIALGGVPFGALEADDARIFPAPRSAFLRSWTGAPGHTGGALIRDGGLTGWGVIRPCRNGCKVGPLVASDRRSAETVFTALIAAVGGGTVFLDVPEVNREAVALAESLGLAPVFETARMYNGPTRPMRIDRLYGVTTFELG
jgi:Acetyltransferase (GNAT) domain/Acetyltransferase (GNAT) family